MRDTVIIVITYASVGFCVAVRHRQGNARSLDKQDGNRYRFLRLSAFITNLKANERKTAAPMNNMRKSIILTCLVAVATFLLSSCGGSVDHSDPQSVAEKAINSYLAYDWETLKTLVDPANEYRLEQLDRIAKSAPSRLPTQSINPVFEKVVERSTGKELTADSKSAVATFKTTHYDRQVFLERVDGKWYVERFR